MDELSDLDILNDEGPAEEKVEETPDEETQEELVEEETESEDEEPEEEEEKSEEDTDDEEAVDGKIAFKALKKEFPEIFKKFPGLRGSLARENEFSKVFPTVEDAQEAGAKIAAINELGSTLMQGDPGMLIAELDNAGGKGLEKFTKNFLPTLYKSHPKLFIETTIPFVNNALRNARDAAIKSKDKNLYLAVQHFSNHLHGDPDVPEDRQRDPELDKERSELESERQKFRQDNVKSFKQDTYHAAFTSIRSAIEKTIDPDGELVKNDFLTVKSRKAAAQDIMDEVDSIIRKDERFMGTIRSLFTKAEQTGLSREASDKIRSAYLARVKPLLSSVRQKVLQDYLPKKAGKSVGVAKRHIPGSGSEGSNKSKHLDPKKIDYSKTSDMDILNDKVVFKK